MKNKYAEFALYVIAFLVMWNIIEYFLHRDTWQILSGDGLVIPLAVAIATGYITILRNRDGK